MPTLDFKGKQFVYSHHLSVPFRELKVDAKKSLPEKGKKPSLDDNLIIHGDNLEALKALLPTHAGKVDCIFIDPPYNTGNEGWCYNDNVRSPLMKEWLKKSANPVDKEDLERHDKWLCMMWPRLQLLRDLLAEHGAIFVTLNDIEAHRFRLLMDEIFGEENFIATVVWQKMDSPSRNDEGRALAEYHDNLFIYAKNKSEVILAEQVRLEINDKYPLTLDDGRKARRRQLRKNGKNAKRSDRPTLWYALEAPDGTEVWPIHPTEKWEGRWVLKKTEWLDREKKGLTQWIKRPSGWVPYYIETAKETPTAPWPSIWTDVDQNRQAKAILNAIFGHDVPFETPKPPSLVERVLDVFGDEEAIVLDSFAGSGTTAHAVLGANKKDGGNRRFILVECEDYADTLTAERVRRVINGYSFSGTKRDKLYSDKITWSIFEKKQAKLLEHIQSIENLQDGEYDRIKKEIKDGVLTIVGEKKIVDTMPGLGGSFTYCTLGEPINIESLLTGKDMPSFDALARYVFYTATGQSLDAVAEPRADGFIGETELFRVHLFYQPDRNWLRSNEAALNAERVQTIVNGNKSGKRAIVFAVAKFISQKDLTKQRIEFCQLPYAVHRVLGD